jgi:hypothetical protein
MTGADEYEGLNVAARLAAGLLTVEAWLRVHQVADAGVDRGGWGHPVSALQVASWRTAARPDHLE